MIKTFEQFVSTVYDRSVNEGFQSKKLSELVKKHGKPRDMDFYSVHSYENNKFLKKRALYDIKDSDIVDVVRKESVNLNRDYNRDSNNKYMPTRIIVLEDGTCVIVRAGAQYDAYVAHEERHRGNLGKDGGDDIHKQHLKNVQRLESNRLAEKMKSYIPEIITYIKELMEDIAEYYASEFQGDYQNFNGYHIELGDKKYLIDVSCESNFDEAIKDAINDETYSYNLKFKLSDIWIRDDETHSAISYVDIEMTDEEFEKFDELFNKEYFATVESTY